MRRLISIAAVLTLLATACGATEDGTITTSSAAPTTTVASSTSAAPGTTADVTTTIPGTEPAPTTSVAAGVPAATALPAPLRSAFEETTATVSSARMAGTIVMTGLPDLPDGAFEFGFEGAFNGAGDVSFSMDLSGLAAAAGDELPPEFADLFGEMGMIEVGDVAYVKFGLFTAMFGAETEWISMPADEGTEAAGFTGATPLNPADFLGPFADAYGSVEEVGPETVRDAATTHYRFVFDMERLLAELSAAERAELESQGPLPLDELPMDVWIGDDGLIRKFQFALNGDEVPTAPGEEFESMVMTFEMWDWGADVVIEPPPADQVTDVEDLAFFDMSLFDV